MWCHRWQVGKLKSIKFEIILNSRSSIIHQPYNVLPIQSFIIDDSLIGPVYNQA